MEKVEKKLSPKVELEKNLNSAQELKDIEAAFMVFERTPPSQSGYRFAYILCALYTHRLSTGSTYILPQQLLNAALSYAKEHGSAPENTSLRSTLRQMIKGGYIAEFSTGDLTYLQTPRDDKEESTLISEFKRTLSTPKTLNFDPVTMYAAIDAAAAQKGVKLSEQQHDAVATSLLSSISIITGGPGCGKTLLIDIILQVVKQLAPDASTALTAPTGKVASRLSDITGKAAQTLHSLLEIRYDGDTMFCIRDHIAADLVIVDEASLMSLTLASRLFYMVSPSARLIFVGDPDQLPSIAPGDVLKDLIQSKAISVTPLTTCYRQNTDAKAITDAATCVNSSAVLKWWPFPASTTLDDSLHFVEADSADAVHDSVLDAVRQLTAQGCAPQDIQVLSPIKNKAYGVDALNSSLRALFNPAAHPAEPFFPGDKVVCTENSFDNGVANGDIGEVVDVRKRTVTVKFGSHITTLQQSKLKLAYALTVYKAQGSEYPIVVLALHSGMHKLLSRALLYTAITRAKSKLVVVGSKATVMEAISTDRRGERQSALGWWLNASCASSAA